MTKLLKAIATLFFITTMPIYASSLTLESSDISHGDFMDKQHEFAGFGCTGKDLSPHLKWSNLPKGTKSIALTAYDPDAPTGSGWWHWQVINIPVSTTELATNAGNPEKDLMPKGSKQMINDYGIQGFGGACPPEGNGAHRYQFTVHALSVENIELPENASGALTGYMINANSIASHTIEALYKRN